MLRQVAVMAARTSWRTVWVVFVLVVLLVVVSFYAFSQQHLDTRPWYHLPAPCTMPRGVMTDLVLLAHNVHEALVQLNVSHALCFGTLWGALRSGRFLPWDSNVDFCALETSFAESSSRVSDVFRQKGVEVNYEWRTGVYAVRLGSAVGSIHTFAVSADKEAARPGGWSGGWFSNSHNKPVSFPVRLLEAPLTSVKFYNKDMPVPHEGIEILKYMYPDDWWLEVKPPGC